MKIPKSVEILSRVLLDIKETRKLCKVFIYPNAKRENTVCRRSQLTDPLELHNSSKELLADVRVYSTIYRS